MGLVHGSFRPRTKSISVVGRGLAPAAEAKRPERLPPGGGSRAAGGGECVKTISAQTPVPRTNFTPHRRGDH